VQSALSLQEENSVSYGNEDFKLSGDKNLKDFLKNSTEALLKIKEANKPELPGFGPSGGSGGGGSYTVKDGDSLSGIAGKFYGDTSRWEEIYEANKSVIGPDSSKIEPGMVLRIP